MKTPRLALIALLALQIAPAANAAATNPNMWSVVEESHGDWPTITFKVGDKLLRLNCRLADCDPAKNKGVSNLYEMTPVGEPAKIKTTIYVQVPLGRFDPRRLIDGPYAKRAQEIDSILTTYETKLSNYKLDNSGEKLAVVQGSNRYPVLTNIKQEQISASGSKIRVAPPSKMADDKIDPKMTGAASNAETPKEPSTPSSAEAPKEAKLPAPALLTDEEIKVLAPLEKSMYTKFKEGGESLKALLAEIVSVLRGRINEEKRLSFKPLPASADMTSAQFNALPEFQKRQFCVDYPLDAVALAGDAKAGELDTRPNALAGVKNSAANPITQAKPATAETAWSGKDRKDACRKLPPEIPPLAGLAHTATGDSALLEKKKRAEADGVGNLGKEEKKKLEEANGVGNFMAKEKEKKEGETSWWPNSWVTRPLVIGAVKGALIGLIVGSLFGPAGLIAGPLIGAALFYGLEMINTPDPVKKP